MVKGTCEFQYCDPNFELVRKGTKHYNSYLYYGPTFKPTTTPTTTPKPTTTTPLGTFTTWRRDELDLAFQTPCARSRAISALSLTHFRRCTTHACPYHVMVVYGVDGWALVGTASDRDLRCIKLNAG